MRCVIMLPSLNIVVNLRRNSVSIINVQRDGSHISRLIVIPIRVAVNGLVILKVPLDPAIRILFISRFVLIKVVALSVVVVGEGLVIIVVHIVLLTHAAVGLADHDHEVARGNPNEAYGKRSTAEHTLVVVEIVPL